MSYRVDKVSRLFKDNLAEILTKDLSLKKGILVSILRVDISKDLRYARIFVSIFPVDQTAYVINTLKKELFRIQGLLNKRLHMKIIPRISFVSDETQEKVSALEDYFSLIEKERFESQEVQK